MHEGLKDAVREGRSARDGIEASSTAVASIGEDMGPSYRGSEPASEGVEGSSRAANIEKLQDQMAEAEGYVAQD